MKIGEKVTRQPESFADIEPKTGKIIRRTMRGKIVYIHPKGRFHVVEFESGVRESFAGV